MKHPILLIYTAAIFFLAGGYSWEALPAIPTSFPATTTSNAACPVTCQTSDSLALVAIYNATQGWNWTNTWNLNSPVCTPWFGVELDEDGYVVELQLNMNNLTGALPPEIGNFSRLEDLQLDNNSLTGTIPSVLGNLSALKIAFLDDNLFSGNIPSEIGNLPNLQILYLDNNDLSGSIPASFVNLNNLQTIDIFNNEINAIPDLSSINIQPNRFRVYNNQLTFDDLVPNGTAPFGNHYHPQDSVYTTTSLFLTTGSTHTIDLGFDASVPNNSYQWYRNNVPFGAPLNTNQLTFDPVDWSTAGTYRCEVTNPDFPLLTLYTRLITVQVSCGISTYDLNSTLCPNGSIEINGTVYDQSNPSGQQWLFGQDQYGCDSLINVDLQFYAENLFELKDTLCIGESLTVNGTVYNQGNPNGLEFFLNADENGCDSLVAVDLSFYPPAVENLQPTICPDDTLWVNGTPYHLTNSSGTEILSNASINGCDSTIQVNLNFYPLAQGNYNPLVCEGENLLYGGVIFDVSNPSGTVNLGPIAAQGCDSLVNVQLGFHPPAATNYTPTICSNGSVVVNGTVYDMSNPSGTEVLSNASVNGCDSTVFVNLNFNTTITEDLSPTLCHGESILVNGTVYDQDNPTGSEMIPAEVKMVVIRQCKSI